MKRKNVINPDQLELFPADTQELSDVLEEKNWSESKRVLMEMNTKDKKFNDAWYEFSALAPASLVEEIIKERGYGMGAKDLKKRLENGDEEGFVQLAKTVLTEDDKLFYYNTLARAAIEQDLVGALEYLEKNGLNIRIQNDSLFLYAAENGALKCMDNLLEKGCNINTNKGQALDKATSNNQIDVFEYLMTHNINTSHFDPDTAFYVASIKGHREMSEYLMNKYPIENHSKLVALFTIYRESDKENGKFPEDVVRLILPHTKNVAGDKLASDIDLMPGIEGLKHLIHEYKLDVFSGYPWVMESFQTNSEVKEFIAEELITSYPDKIETFKPFFKSEEKFETRFRQAQKAIGKTLPKLKRKKV